MALVCQIYGKLLSFISQALYVLGNLVAVQRELSELFVLISKGLVVTFDLSDFIL